MKELLDPERLWTRNEILTPKLIPARPGVYAWWFREIPSGVPTEQCLVHDGLTLLYVGTAPKAPASDGKQSRATLRRRLLQHMRGNASGSTLRLTLGCLLSKQLGIELCRVGNGERLTFGKSGEQALCDWMEENAFVSWQVCEQPWIQEAELIRSVNLPLNLDQNRQHPFFSTLRACRAAARAKAKILPVQR